MGAHTYDYETRWVDGKRYDITVTRFTNDPGLSYDLYLYGHLLTEDESLDHPPTDDEVRDLLAGRDDNYDDSPVIVVVRDPDNETVVATQGVDEPHVVILDLGSQFTIGELPGPEAKDTLTGGAAYRAAEEWADEYERLAESLPSGPALDLVFLTVERVRNVLAGRVDEVPNEVKAWWPGNDTFEEA